MSFCKSLTKAFFSTKVNGWWDASRCDSSELITSVCMTLVRRVLSSFAISSIWRFIAKKTSAEPSTTGGGTKVEPPPMPGFKGHHEMCEEVCVWRGCVVRIYREDVLWEYVERMCWNDTRKDALKGCVERVCETVYRKGVWKICVERVCWKGVWVLRGCVARVCCEGVLYREAIVVHDRRCAP